MTERRKIARAAGLMSIATFISRILGYGRDMVLAFYFGATGVSDTFFVAFRIPNLLRELFAEGSMTAAVIPVLTEYQNTKGFEESKRLLRVAFTFVLIAAGAITVLGIVFAPAIVSVIAPGFVKSPEKFSTAVLLTRIMFPFLLFISLAALLMGGLNTRRIFFIPALAPAMLNITIIGTVFILASRIAEPVVAVAWGVLLGGVVQFAFQVPSALKEGYSLRPDYDFRHQGLKKIGRLVAPATLGMAANQVNVLISSILASFLAGGSITYLFYSMHLIQFPVGIFGVAMGMAVLPSLSGHALAGDTERLREDFSFSLRLLFFLTVPAMAGLIALREPIISTLFQRGRFDYAATKGTADALLFYSLGIWSMVGVRVVAATFYSMQDTKTPARVAVAALTANIVLSLLLMGPMSYKGLALANAAASMLNFSLLFYFLRKKLRRLGSRKILNSFLKVSLSSAVMAVSVWLLLRGGLWAQTGMAAKKAAYLGGAITLSIGVYFIINLLLKSEEAEFVVGMIRGRLKGRSHEG
ncbi:MAG: murein biosynthesis integral membrane protein MurJ [Thermodesulfovibrionales bacterium]|nr:murein biosynthesis integral membrane protein MurJ [Thermodesulfovibrionales bacterium]